MKDRRNDKVRPINGSDWDRPRLKKVLHSFGDKKILVIGDVGIDRYIMGSVERISPEAPVPIVAVQEERLKLGLAANVADNVKTLGGTPLLVGLIGSDRAADDFRGLLKNAGISSGYLVRDGERRTVLKERIVSERQQLLRVDYENLEAISAKTEKLFLQKLKELVSRADAVILEDYAKGLLSRKLAHEIFVAAKKKGKIVAVDPNVKTGVAFYKGATLLTPNTKEAEALSGVKITDQNTLFEAGKKILAATDAGFVVITRGKDGMAIFKAGEKSVSLIPTYAREVYDVSGAGDTVIAVLALAMASGASIEEASILGNLAAGVEVGKRGTATVTPDEVVVSMDLLGQLAV
jgi:rfaE bifunctional protein kinase chain/domain